MKIDKSKIKKYIIIFLFICLCFMITDKLVKADTISSYSTRYYWCTSNGSNSTCTYTPFRSGTDNKVTLNGAEQDIPTYSQYETFNGMNNLINVSLKSGSTYTFTINLIYGNLAANEFGLNNLYRFNTYKSFSAGTITNVSTNYSKSSNCYNYGGTQYCDYNVNVVYTIIPSSNVSSFYLGSYTTGDSTLGIDYHYINSVTRVNSISYSVNNDSTIVNQNETIIDQNQTIIDKQDEIINNQNENTDKIIEENKKNFQSCHDSLNLLDISVNTQTINGVTFTVNEDKTITANGTATSDISLTLNSNLLLNTTQTYNISGVNGGSDNTYYLRIVANNWDNNIFLYNNSVNFKPIYNLPYFVRIVVKSGTTLNNVRFSPMLTKGTKKIDYEEYGKEICTNKLDQQTNAINDLNDSLTDTSSPDAPDFGNSLDVSSMTPITDLITMPITLYNKIITESNKSCSSYSIPFGLVAGSDYTLTFPCIDIGNYLGSNLKGIIDDLFCLFMIYEICMLGVTIFNDATSLKDSFDSLYVPRHSSDIPRHGGPVNYG